MSKQARLKNYLTDLPDFVFRFIEGYYDGESINTQLGYSLDIRTFLNFLIFIKRFKGIDAAEEFTPEHMEQITADDLISYKSYLKEYTTVSVDENGVETQHVHTNSAYGINRKLSTLRSLFSYLYKTDKISKNVTEKIDLAQISQKIKKPLTTLEVMKLVDVIMNGEKYFTDRHLLAYNRNKLRDIAIYICYLGTGIRVSELVNLNITDIDFDNSSFIVTRKGGKQQEIYMPVQVENELFKYYNERIKLNTKDPALFFSSQNKRITVSAIEKNLKKYCQVAGITHPDKTRPHALRRTFACTLLEEGIDIKMVADLMGHSNIEVTHKFYAQYASHAKRAVMRKHEIINENKSASDIAGEEY